MIKLWFAKHFASWNGAQNSEMFICYIQLFLNIFLELLQRLLQISNVTSTLFTRIAEYLEGEQPDANRSRDGRVEMGTRSRMCIPSEVSLPQLYLANL